MKTFSPAALAALAAGEIHLNAAVKCVFGQGTHRLWSGQGPLSLPGEAGAFTGCACPMLVTPVRSELGGGAAGATVSVSGLDPDIAATIEDEDYHQRPVVIWYLVFAADRLTLLDHKVFLRARCDYIKQAFQAGGEAAITLFLEGPSRDMGRAGGRIASDADQRVLGGAADGGMQHISVAGVRTLYWGARPQNLSSGFSSTSTFGDAS